MTKPAQEKPTELRTLEDVLAEIIKHFLNTDLQGVQGFSITCRYRIASMNLKWGDLRMRRRKTTDQFVLVKNP